MQITLSENEISEAVGDYIAKKKLLVNVERIGMKFTGERVGLNGLNIICTVWALDK